MNGVGGAPSRSHRQDHGGAARNNISSGEYSFARGALGFFAGLNVSLFVGAQSRSGALHDGISAGADRDHCHG